MESPNILCKYKKHGTGPPPDDIAESQIIMGDLDDIISSAAIDSSITNWDSLNGNRGLAKACPYLHLKHVVSLVNNITKSNSFFYIDKPTL